MKKNTAVRGYGASSKTTLAQDVRSKAILSKKPPLSDKRTLQRLLKESFNFFLKEMNPVNGLMPDKTAEDSPASTASVGFALSAYVVAVEYKILSRAEAARRTLLVLRTLQNGRQGTETTAAGYKGFFYHFLDMQTGARKGDCELSTIDTAVLMMGILTVAQYFTSDVESKDQRDGLAHQDEAEIRKLAKDLYERVDWRWALNGGMTLSHGWKPESGFLPERWDEGYSEAHILYILALGSPLHAIDAQVYETWISHFEWMTHEGTDYLYAGPLFIHQMSQAWLDLKGLTDTKTREKGIDYFTNSARATAIQRNYAIQNPHGFIGYSKNCWGVTACEGPKAQRRLIDGMRMDFYGYFARGAPFGPDDGTLSPWVIVASLPFAPEIVVPAVRYAVEKLKLHADNGYGFETSYNSTFNYKIKQKKWVSSHHYGINQGPVVLMIANYEKQLIWNLLRNCPPIVRGLKAAGFKGGWLGAL